MAKKRANGEGSIRKRSDGRWEGRYTAGYHPETGKRIIKNVLGKTQAECKAKLSAALESVKGIDVSRADEYTVATWLRSWYDIYAKPNIRVATADRYHLMVEQYTIPRIGNTPTPQGRSRMKLHKRWAASWHRSCKQKKTKIPERRQKLPLRYSLDLSGYFRVWVTVWVRRLTHILTHTIFSVFATKKHRKPKFSMLLSGGFNSDIFVLEALHRNGFEFSIEFRMRLFQIFSDAIRTPVRIQHEYYSSSF